MTSLRERVARDPNETAAIFVSGSTELRSSKISYADLDLHSRRIASWLQERYAPGERVLLVYSPGLEFVTAFFACAYAGLIAVPAPVPARSGHQHRRLAAIARDAGVRILLTQEDDRQTMEKWAAEAGVPGLLLHSTDSGAGDPDTWTAPELTPDSIALLQYTSGSTGDPKGVMVSHGNLTLNGERIATALGLDSESRYGGWIPLYHDMGLIGVMLPGILLGRGYVQLDSLTFLRNPFQWLRMMDDFDIQMTASPDFGYDICVRRATDEQLATLDLSRVRAAVNGSEPVRAATLDRFQQRFGQAGFSPEAMVPMYGLAEATLMASGSGGRAPLNISVGVDALERGLLTPAVGDEESRLLTGCGTDSGAEAIVVDTETHEVLPEGRIGEIWLGGPCVAHGYWGNEAATEEAFGARTADGRGPYLRSGDLGAWYQGDLFVTGRRKDVLILHGRNLYPHDIEDELRERHEELDGLRGAVFMVGGDDVDTEPVVIVVHETRQQAGSEGAVALAAAVKQSTAREFGVPVGAVALIRPRSVRRTTSGKIQRRAMRELYLTEQLDPVLLSEDPLLTEALTRHRAARAEQQEQVSAEGTRAEESR